MYVLLGALLLALLIAGTNIGNLSVVDVIGRRLATMTRLAMGASRQSIVRLRMMETSLLAMVAIVAGLLVAFAALKLLIAIDPTPFVALGTDWIDTRVVVVAVAAIGTVAFGATVPPAIAEARVDIGAIAGGATKSAGGKSDRRLRHALYEDPSRGHGCAPQRRRALGRDFIRLMSTNPVFNPRVSWSFNSPSRHASMRRSSRARST
jgi:hypothetical protein